MRLKSRCSTSASTYNMRLSKVHSAPIYTNTTAILQTLLLMIRNNFNLTKMIQSLRGINRRKKKKACLAILAFNNFYGNRINNSNKVRAAQLGIFHMIMSLSYSHTCTHSNTPKWKILFTLPLCFSISQIHKREKTAHVNGPDILVRNCSHIAKNN